MIPATEPRTHRDSARLLVLHSSQETFRDAMITDLPEMLQPGDLLIVNDAATLPASLSAKSPTNASIEIRLVHHIGGSDWRAVILGPGDWRTPTELRDPPERLSTGSVLHIAKDCAAEVIDDDPGSGRLVTLRFSKQGIGMWTAIYAYGRPIQYSYLQSDLALWSVQTVYASRPWAVEMPSAGHPLTWQILLELRRRGVRIAALTHAAGISAVGDEDLDARLPFAERFDIPQSTVDAIQATRRVGGRVIAVGTTVVRALEGCAINNGGRVIAGAGQTDLVIRAQFRLAIVDGILTGVHDPAQSHFRLLRAFADETLLRRAWRHATASNYLCHEFGDLCLVIPSGALPRLRFAP
jgi:S-adenosylmethionine:tRNA ribosyltransferase-isomerase